MTPRHVAAPTNDDYRRRGQQSKQGEEHHLVGVDEAVQGQSSLLLSARRSS